MELSVPVSDSGQSEILTALLSDLPFESFLVEEGSLKAYAPAGSANACREQAERILRRCAAARATFTRIEDRDWNAAWEETFRMADVGGECRIRSPRAPAPPPGWTDIIINPRMAFGTGCHPTTRMVVREILSRRFDGSDALDVGSGSGVLAIAAFRRGARSVDAVDNDPRAAANCAENAAANGAQGCIRVIEGTVEAVAGRRYDLVTANIFRNVLLEQMPAYAAALRSGGTLILSGFMQDDAPAVREAAAAEGMAACRTLAQEGWAAVICSK